MASPYDKPIRAQDPEPQGKSTPVFHDTLKDGSPGPTMVWIPTGNFRMGDSRGTGWENEGPIHKVSVARFAIGIYPLTFSDYDRFAEATQWTKPDDQGWGRGNQPVINVSWIDAVAYCIWLSEQTGEPYRLPTEAEWEYAARAGTTSDYWWGDNIGRNNTNCRGSNTPWSGERSSPVDAFQANPFGLHDTLGNVWEWTCSKYENRYQGEEQHFFEKTNLTVKRTIRGGSWHTPPIRARASARTGSSPDYRSYGRGFRVASRTSPPFGAYPGWMP